MAGAKRKIVSQLDAGKLDMFLILQEVQRAGPDLDEDVLGIWWSDKTLSSICFI